MGGPRDKANVWYLPELMKATWKPPAWPTLSSIQVLIPIYLLSFPSQARCVPDKISPSPDVSVAYYHQFIILSEGFSVCPTNLVV